MQVLVVYTHPEPRSFNAALKDLTVDTLAAGGHSVEVSDLYAEGFDPVESPAHYPVRADAGYFAPLSEQRHAYATGALAADVRRELERLERADLIVFHYPLWWHAQPAILKGWFDRTLVYGGRYSGRMRYDRGYFRGRRAVSVVTTGSPSSAFELYGRGGRIEHLMLPMHYSLYYVGLDVLTPFVAYGVQGGGLSYQAEESFRAQLEAQKRAWSLRLQTIEHDESIPFTGWADWDADGRIDASSARRWAVY